MEQTKDETNAGLTFNCTENMSSTMTCNKTKKESLSTDLKKKKKSSLSKTTVTSVAADSAKKPEKKSKSICFTSKSNQKSVLIAANSSIRVNDNKTKKLNKTVGFASGTKDVSKLALPKVDMTNMSNQELIKRIEELELKVDQSKSNWIKYESDLRRELVTKWSKRVEDQDAFHQEEIKKQRMQVEDHWSKKMGMLEELCEIKTASQLKEREKDHQNQLEKLQEKILEMEAELKKTYDQLDSAKASLKTATDKNLFQIKSERMSQSAFETHLRLDEREEDTRLEGGNGGDSVYMSAPTYDKTIPHNNGNESSTNKRKLSLDSYEEDDYGIGNNNNNMDFEEDNSSYGGGANFANGSKTSLGSKSKRRNTLANHSMQTDMVRGGNTYVQTESIERRSVGTEVSILIHLKQFEAF